MKQWRSDETFKSEDNVSVRVSELMTCFHAKYIKIKFGVTVEA